MERDTQLIEVSFTKREYTMSEVELLNQYAQILPNLLITMNYPLELPYAQDEHIRIVSECMKAGLLDEICQIRDQFRQVLGDDQLA